MNDKKIIIMLLVIAGLTVLIYLIYKAVQDNKREEELKFEREKYEQEQEKNRIKERQKKSVEWNKKIQELFNNKIKYETNISVKVLVGDYTDSMAPFTNSVLRSMGIETEVVPSASDIIDRITDEKKYDIIITNNTYPRGESGEKVLELKENDDFKIPVIVLTTEMKSRDRFLSYGFDEYIEKPLDEEKVKKVFTKFIKGLEFKKIKSSKSK